MSTEKTPCPKCGVPFGIGDWFDCKGGHGKPYGGTLLKALHPSERPVVYENPRTGELRFPATADSPLPGVYARQGYVRTELDSPAAIKSFEKRTGRVHERSHYDSANDSTGAAERSMTAPATSTPTISGLDG